MTFQTIALNIAGPSYQDRSRPLSSQETRNIYHEYVESGKDKYVLKSFPGQKLLYSAPAGADRGMHQMAEVAYRVIGITLYEIAKIGTHTARGTIKGADRCIFADDGINMFIVSDGIVNQYNSISQDVTLITDLDIVGAQSVAFINNQFAYTFPSLTVFSDVGDGSTATSLNAAGAESNPDDLVRDYTFDQVLYRAGKRSIEPWYNSGAGTPPFDRIEGQIINSGLAAIHSMTSTCQFMYWLGSDLQVYRARGGQEQVISTAAIAGEVQSYTKTDDAFGETFTLDNNVFYMLTFPTANKTWCIIEGLGLNGWFELSKDVAEERYNAGSVLQVYGKTLIGNEYNGDLYELDFNTYDQAGSPWRRRRVISSINGDALGQKGKRVQMSRLELIIQTGNGLLSGQGEDPLIMIEASYDGGNTWRPGSWLKTGRQGEFNIRAEWFSMKSFYDMMIRITTSDPVPLNVFSAAIDLRLAGR